MTPNDLRLVQWLDWYRPHAQKIWHHLYSVIPTGPHTRLVWSVARLDPTIAQ
jgi:hypothetical protein